MKENIISRETRIDILRFIAIVCIIVAHSGPNKLMFQARNFDVILMTLVMGLSFYLSSVNKRFNYFDYVKKRFYRLIIPTWKFLIIFFCFFYLLALVKHDFFYFGYRAIIGSFTIATIDEGIGYVWIMRIFFTIALVSPFVLWVSQRVNDNLVFLFYICLALFFYSILLSYEIEYMKAIQSYLVGINPIASTILNRLNYIILQSIGYSIVAAFGIRMLSLNRREVFFCCLISLIVLLELAYKYNFAPTQEFKYPPNLYYLSFGMFISLLAFLFLGYKRVRTSFENPFVFFVSRTSAWLYFWHIIFIYIIQFYGTSFFLISGNFVGRFLFIFIGALVITYLQEAFQTKWIKVRNKYFVKQAI